MQRMIPLLALLLMTSTGAIAQDASGIRSANLKNADLSLMTNHDPAVEQASFDYALLLRRLNM